MFSIQAEEMKKNKHKQRLHADLTKENFCLCFFFLWSFCIALILVLPGPFFVGVWMAAAESAPSPWTLTASVYSVSPISLNGDLGWSVAENL